MFQKTFCLASPTIPSNNPILYWCYCWILNRDWLVNGILKIRMWQRSFAPVYHIIARSSVYYLWANQGLNLRRRHRRMIGRGNQRRAVCLASYSLRESFNSSVHGAVLKYGFKHEMIQFTCSKIGWFGRLPLGVFINLWARFGVSDGNGQCMCQGGRFFF